MSRSPLELQLAAQIANAGLPEPRREYHFARDIVGHGPGIRKRLAEAGLQDWRLDFAWVDAMVAAEVDGGTWTQHGRHTRGSGFQGDCYKLNAASLHFWRVFRFTAGMLNRNEAIPVLKEALDNVTR